MSYISLIRENQSTEQIMTNADHSERKIFLVDMNAFYISCEERLDSSLRDKNAAVAGDPAERAGIILTANYNARRYGVKTAMSVYEAKKLCPDLLLVKPDHTLYSGVSQRIMRMLYDYSPIVEQNSIDEAWMDMTGAEAYFEMTFVQIAADIQKRIYREEEIPCSVGISYNRFLSKMAAEMKKPNGIVSLDGRDLKDKLWPLPIEKMYGCGRVTSAKLKSAGIDTIGRLAAADPVMLKKKFGAAVISLHRNANGTDETGTVNVHGKAKSVSRETTLQEDTIEREKIIYNMAPLIDDVARQLREMHSCFSTVYIILKYNDFNRITRQTRVRQTGSRDTMWAAVRKMLSDDILSRPVRLIGVGVTDICGYESLQLGMFDTSEQKTDAIYKIIDETNKRYGTEVIKRGFYGK